MIGTNPVVPKIADLFETKVAEKIPPVIKVGDRDDEAKLASEISSYVVTPLIEGHVDDFLERFTDTFHKDTEDIGVWISGYFGSGKSHFAKILQLVVENRGLAGVQASRRFEARVAADSPRRGSIARALALLDQCGTRVLAFNLSSLVDSKKTPLPKLLLSQHYRDLGYSGNVIYARVIESELDKAGKLADLRTAVEQQTGRPWSQVQDNLTFYRTAIYKAVCEVAPRHFGSPEDVDKSLRQAEHELRNVQFLVRALLDDLDSRRERAKRPQRLMFVLDELGQWIENSADRVTQLQALVEEFAIAGKGRLWLVVTTHGDMASIYREARALDADYRKADNRFFLKPALTTENIELVLEERLFRKKLAAVPAIEALYARREGVLRGMGELANTSQTLPACTKERFTTYYPFFPYQVRLIPDIVKSLRAKGGRGEEMAGSTRTLLAITQDVLRSGRRGYLDAPLGTLVSFDEVYENLVGEGEISPDVRTEISRIKESVRGATPMTTRVAEVLYLIRELAFIPRTKENIGRFLMEQVDEDLPTVLARVEPELERLRLARMVAPIGEEWEFLTGERRSFEDEVGAREGGIRQQDRERGLIREFVHRPGEAQWRKWLSEARVAHKGRAFPFQLSVDGFAVPGTEGAVAVRLISPLGALGGPTLDEVENDSLRPEHQNTIYFRSGRVPAFSQDLARFLAMREVVNNWKGDPQKPEEARRLATERETNDLPKLQGTVLDGFREAIRTGHVVFRGASRAPAVSAGQTPSDALRQELAAYWPVIYSKFDKVPHRVVQDQKAIVDVLAGRALSGEVKALRLYDGAGKLDPSAPLVDAIRLHLNKEQKDGRRVLGKDLLALFEAPPYGWDSNAVRVAVAALVRAGAVKLVINKKTYANPADNDVVNAIRVSRDFDKVELLPEGEPPPQELLEETRAFLIQLTRNKKLDETPAALSDCAEQLAEGLLEKAGNFQIWADAVRFPAPATFADGKDAWNDVTELSDAGQRVKQVHATREALKAGAATIEAHAAFKSEHATHFSEAERLVSDLRPIAYRFSAGSAMAVLLDEWQAAEASCAFADKDVWNRLQAWKADVNNDLVAVIAGWRAAARTTLSDALNGLPGRLAERSLEAALEADLGVPLRTLLDRLDTVTRPAQAAQLPDEAQSLVRALGERIEAEARKGQPQAPQPPDLKPTVRLRVRDQWTAGRVRTLAEWEELRGRLDAWVKAQLDLGRDIEFD